MSYTVSVVIPAYNEEANITKCLQALVEQQTSHTFSVILVDNASTDKTVQIAKQFINTLDLTIVSEKQKGRGTARATGFDYAKTDIIFSTDADTQVPTDWIENHYIALTSKHCVATTGPSSINDCGVIKNVIVNLGQPLSMHLYRLLFNHYWLSGFNFAIFKTAYAQSEGFDRTLNAQEDIDLSFKVKKVGSICYLNNTSVIFSGRRFKKGVIKGSLEYLTTFIAFVRSKDKTVTLSDPR